jgi:hypothetical protein
MEGLDRRMREVEDRRLAQPRARLTFGAAQLLQRRLRASAQNVHERCGVHRPIDY